jgi:translation initiation factor 1 (eIF-1/SUI1)
MGMKKNKPPKSAPSGEPFHSALSGLASLRDQLPTADTPVSEPKANAEAEPDTTTSSVKLLLQREKKGRAGKTVTRLRGLPSAEARHHWAKKLKKEFGCGASIEGDDLILLGDLGERAKERLEASGFQHVILCN